MRRLVTRYTLACIALIALLTVIVFANDLGHFNTDIKPEVYLSPWTMVGRYLSSWTSSPYLGSANFNVGLVPVLLVLSGLRFLGLSPEWTFKVFHLVLWLIAAWGANRLTRAAAPRAGKYVALAAGTFYLANPYAIAGGSTLAIALPMAFLPWMLLAYLRAVQHPRSWGWPAAFGLSFFAMSGMNVAVVPLFQLFGIVPIMVVARWHHQRSWGELARVTGKCALFVVLLSLYWLVPAISALGAGTQIVDQSETLNGIHKVSSLTEVLRGLGLWPLYGQSDTGPWVPQDAVYLTSTPVIILTALWPALSIAALRWARSGLRRAVALTVAIAAVIMVGIFPGEGRAESPAGWVLQGVLSFPGLVAFRTTNKIGALLALAFAVALSGGLFAAAKALRGRGPLVPVASSLALIMVAAWVLPALANGLYISRMDIPSYWKKAAKAADEGDKNSSVLMLPAQTRPTYRWTVQRPDDLANALLKRDAVIPETTPNASLPGANFLAALGDTVEEGVSGGDIVSTYARYLGASSVLLRNDTVWETDGGARPSQVASLISGDKNLFGLANFGKPGQNTISPTSPPTSLAEALLPPVQLYGVEGARTAVRAESTKNQVIVAGDGWAFPSLVGAGLLNKDPMVRYALDENAKGFASSLDGGAHLVITDTNARRNAIPQRLTANEGALLDAQTPLTNTRTLGTSASDQTVLVRSGIRATATSSGATFFDMPFAIPENAVDGDPDTSWRFGDFRRAAGQKLTLTLPSKQTLGDITLSQPNLGPVHISKATMSAGGKSVTTTVPTTGSGVFHMGGVKADQVTVTIDSIAGDGFNLVGISELGLPGASAGRAARTPHTFTRLYDSLSAAQRAKFAQTPLDILLQRVLNTSSPADDSETALYRIVSLPDSRRYSVSADVRLRDGDRETLYDRVYGVDTSTTDITSSGFYFNRANARASQAADASDATGWTPDSKKFSGAWWQWKGGQHDVSKVTITQKAMVASADKTEWARGVSLFVDGRKVAAGQLNPNGSTTIDLHGKYSAHSLRLVVDSTSGPRNGSPATFTTIDAGFSTTQSKPGQLDKPGQTRCLNVATVDGSPVPMRLDDSSVAGPQDAGTKWTACAPVSLKAGDHRIEQSGDFTIDSMKFSDTSGKAPAAAVQPSGRILENTATTKKIAVGASSTPVAVVAGQSYDARWHASANGRDLGPATTIDGFSTGWILPAGKARTVTMTFAPQKSANVALGVSLVALMVAAGLAVALLFRRKRWAEPVGASESSRLTELDDVVASEPNSRAKREVVFVVAATFCVGLAGLVGALGVVVAIRWKHATTRHIVWTGAALVVAGVILYCVLDPSIGQVSADAISSSMWPHRLAALGLVVGLGGLMRGNDSDSAHRKDRP